MKDALKDARMPTCCRIPYRKTSYITEPFRPVILNYKDEFGMPYWDHWQKVDEILLEELIALSVYLDPLRFPGSEPQRKAHLDIYIKAVGATNVDESGNDYYDNNEINRNPTNDRLEAANDAIDEGSLRPDRVVVNETGRIYYINRVKFVNWALSLGWELPPGMAAWATPATCLTPEAPVQPAAIPPPEPVASSQAIPEPGNEDAAVDPWAFLPKKDPDRKRAIGACKGARWIVDNTAPETLMHGNELSARRVVKEMQDDQDRKWWVKGELGRNLPNETTLYKHVNAWLQAGMPDPSKVE
ncbi:MAG: hypothetical protein HQL56_11660 [Magnetococcales bacterium]|nr:hypothetical protein [Magnetococcales bacterium]